MKKLDRRDFVKVLGMGSVGVAAASVLPGVLSGSGGMSGSALAFRAVGGLPSAPKPTIVSYVLDGTLDLKAQSGTLTRTVYMGPPNRMSRLVLPGMSRTFRVTEARESVGGIAIKGVTDDRSQFRRGESPSVDFEIDTYRKVVRAPFLNSRVPLPLESIQRL